MRDDFDALLRAGTEEFAAKMTPRPVHQVRARGDQRRRRAVTASAVLALVVAAGGGSAAYAAIGHSGGGARPVAPLVSASPTPHPAAPRATGRPVRQTQPPTREPAAKEPAVVGVTSGGAVVVLNPATGATVRTLAAAGGFADEVSVSPAGPTVYYAAKHGCSAEIYSVPLAGGASTAITAGAEPAISPDGTRLAFVREPYGSGGAPVYQPCAPVPATAAQFSLVVRDLGRGSETAYPMPPGFDSALPFPVSHLSWSPDGTRLAVSIGQVQDNQGWGVVVLDPTTARYYVPADYTTSYGVPVPGPPVGSYYREGVFLPDGDLLVSRVCCAGVPVRTTFSVIWEVSASGTFVHPVAVGFTNRDHTSLDASGRWVLYLSGSDLFVSKDGNRPTMVSSGLVAAAWVPAASGS